MQRLRSHCSAFIVQRSAFPASGRFEVGYSVTPGDAGEQVEVIMMDFSARVVRRVVLPAPAAGRYVQTLDAGDLPSGPYVVAVRTARNAESVRVVVRR